MLSTLIRISLVLTLLATPLTRAENSELLKSQPWVILSEEETDALARFKIQCDINKKDLRATKEAYQTCIDAHQINPQFWQTPVFVVGGITLGLAAGIIIGTGIK